MTTVVTLDVFSGRSNPVAHLTEAQENELNARLTSLKGFTHKRPSGVLGGLGYRGFTISRHNPAFASSGHIRIHESIVDRGVEHPNLIDDTGLESFLLPLFHPHLPQGVIEHAMAKLTAADTFSAMGSKLPCPKCAAADAPAYAPATWNNPAVQPHNNCYNYANDHATNTFAQPGRAHGATAVVMDCAHVEPAAVRDGLLKVANFSRPLGSGQGWYVGLVIWPGADYHWYRQDQTGCWSHKPGSTAARDIDNSGHSIADPATCDRGPYTVFCCYMVTNRKVVIA